MCITYPGDGVVRPLDTLDGVRLLRMELLDVLDRLRRRSLTEEQTTQTANYTECTD
jgi:hypothetical protein